MPTTPRYVPRSGAAHRQPTKAPGQTAYEAYAEAQAWLAMSGLPMPPWPELDDETRGAWTMAECASGLLIIGSITTFLEDQWRQAHQTSKETL